MVDQVGNNAGAQLKSVIERVERIMEEKKALQDDIKDIFAEAKSNGFDAKALRALIKLRAQDQAERQEFDAVLQTYASAVGFVW